MMTLISTSVRKLWNNTLDIISMSLLSTYSQRQIKKIFGSNSERRLKKEKTVIGLIPFDFTRRWFATLNSTVDVVNWIYSQPSMYFFLVIASKENDRIANYRAFGRIVIS